MPACGSTGTGYAPVKQARQKSSGLPLAGQQPLERQVAERVHAQVVADLLHRLERADELAPAGRVDAVEAGVGDGRRADAEVDLPRARARRSRRTSLRLVVPRTMESSTTTTRRPSRASRTGLNLIRTLESRPDCCGWMKVRPT